LVAISAILIAGSAAYFSVTGLGVLFSGAAIAVMVMAGSLEFAKLVTATYLKQKWDEIKGLNKWYLSFSVVVLMGITSAGIFGYLSNAFQQQNIKLEQVQREVNVWDNKIKLTNDQIVTLQLQQKDLSSTQNSLITKGNVNSRLIRSADNRDKQSTKISNKINSLQDSLVSYNGKINDIKNNNIDIEREVGGFRFVAEAFNVELKTVVKFFIILIVIVFDPLAIALVIAFNQLIMTKRKDEEEIPSKPEELKDFVDETTRIHLSENDLKKLEEVLLNPPLPNEKLKEAAQRYSDEVREKHTHIDDFEETSVKSELTQEERGEILAEMMKNDQELGLYDEPFDNPLINPETTSTLNVPEMMLTTNQEIIESIPSDDEFTDWDVTLMDGLDEDESFFTDEEIENILQQPTEDEVQQNFSTITPKIENNFQQDFVPGLSDEEVMEINQDEYERKLDMDDEFDGFVPEPFATPEEVEKFNLDESIKEYFDEKEEDPAIEIIDNEILSDELYEEVDDSDEDDLKKKS
jgi:hypothetical protein